MKLELKHLAAYLPYGLKMLNTKSGKIIDVIGLQESVSCIRLFTTDAEYQLDIWPLKLLLVPITELALTTPIIIKGSKVDAEVKPSEYIATSIKDSQKNMRMLLNDGAEGLEQWKFERLLQLHFDVFGLIDAGLAINKNDID